MIKAVFLDKDGTLIDDIPYNVNPDLITLKEGAADGLQKLKETGYKFIVVSNQSGVARGYFDEGELKKVENRLKELLGQYHVDLEAFYYCPHHPEGRIEKYSIECNCRKPAPGMLQKAAAEHRIDLKASWMLGDILNDVEAGNRAGCHSILIDNGGETEWIKDNPYREPEATFSNISFAADYILERSVDFAASPKDLAEN